MPVKAPRTPNEFRLTVLALAEAHSEEEPDFASIVDVMNALNEAESGAMADFSPAERLVFLCVQLTGLATCASSPAFQVAADDIALGEEMAAGIKRIFARLVGLEDADVEAEGQTCAWYRTRSAIHPFQTTSRYVSLARELMDEQLEANAL